MKKSVKMLILALLLAMIASPAYASSASGIQIQVDGVTIPSGVKPESKNYRTMVPLRVVAESLAANVEWKDPEVRLSKHNLEVTLKANSKTAVVNGQNVQMDVAPYIKNSRIFVPLRFVSEAFGYKVDYVSPTVTIETTPLLLDGERVHAFQSESRMTMGSIVQQITGNAYIEAIYYSFMESKGEEIEAPLIREWITGTAVLGSYTTGAKFDFLDEKGESLLKLVTYSLNYDFPAELLAPYPRLLLHDVNSDQWFTYPSDDSDDISDLFQWASDYGFLTVVSNTVV